MTPTSTTPETEPAGRGWARVQREQRRAKQDEALAVIAEDRHWARRTRAYRARKLEQTHRRTALAGAVLMAGLGAWSAVGVHHAVAAGAPTWSPDWVLGWILEPVLLAGVALIVLVRSSLALAGAKLTGWAWLVELGLLSLSLAANVRALPANPTVADGVLRLTGPIGCLLVSCILVAVDRAIREADIDTAPESATAAADRWAALTGRVRALGVGAADRAIGAVETVVAPVADSGADSLRTVHADSARTASADSADSERGQRALSADTLADSLRTVADTERGHPADSGADSSGHPLSAPVTSERTVRTAVADSARTASADSADTVREVSAELSTDSGADTFADSGADSGADTAELPTVRPFTTREDAIAIARTLDTDTLTTLTIRPLADRLQCGRTTATRVRTAVLAEREHDTETEEPDEPVEPTEAADTDEEREA